MIYFMCLLASSLSTQQPDVPTRVVIMGHALCKTVCTLASVAMDGPAKIVPFGWRPIALMILIMMRVRSDF